jgi:hypothetical protein
LIFPVLKSKYQSVNSGNLKETVIGGSSNSFILRNDNHNTITLSGAAISQAMSYVETSLNNKYASGLHTKRGLNPSPAPKNGASTMRNSS